MTSNQVQVLSELKHYLITNGFTFNAEGEALGEPTITRQVNVDILVSEVVNYLTAQGYMSPYKLTGE